MSHAVKQFVPLNLAVITVSDTRTEANDTSGDYLRNSAIKAGHNVIDSRIIVDDIYQIRALASTYIADPQIQVVLITGGTGFTERDSTPEAMLPLFDKQVDGFGELFRHISFQEIGTSTIQSRALAGFANHTIVFCLPGSTGACRTAWEGIICAQLNGEQGPCNFVPHLNNTQVAPCKTRTP
ncbi:molybdenum cofactor biosynthesis protein B [Alteromonas sp. 14N.309.X.WAT.G.H12]|uniref:molybdenum cofactor biosynthesis protein B n=1 Tax=Alteromonas sp. 14N.309.X.WAT.G.H12 TaxID=3120824 RepID=UPI002FD37D05